MLHRTLNAVTDSLTAPPANVETIMLLLTRVAHVISVLSSVQAVMLMVWYIPPPVSVG